MGVDAAQAQVRALALETLLAGQATWVSGRELQWVDRTMGRGRWVPTFPNARYVFTRKELEAWQRGHPKFTRDPLEDSVLPVIAAGLVQPVDEHEIERRPPLDPSERGTARVRSARNSSKSTMRLNRSLNVRGRGRTVVSWSAVIAAPPLCGTVER